MPKIKTQHKGLMLHFAAFVLAVFGLAIINSGSAFAAASLTTGVFTDDAGGRSEGNDEKKLRYTGKSSNQLRT